MTTQKIDAKKYIGLANEVYEGFDDIAEEFLVDVAKRLYFIQRERHWGFERLQKWAVWTEDSLKVFDELHYWEWDKKELAKINERWN